MHDDSSKLRDCRRANQYWKSAGCWRPYVRECTALSHRRTNGLAALFDPSTLTWASTGTMNKYGKTMTVLLNGQVLVACGDTFDKGFGHLVQIASAELYTPLWQEVNYFRFKVSACTSLSPAISPLQEKTRLGSYPRRICREPPCACDQERIDRVRGSGLLRLSGSLAGTLCSNRLPPASRSARPRSCPR